MANSTAPADLAARAAEFDWYHTIELAPGVIPPGHFDTRPTAAKVPMPASLAGKRCLDVGTMDGFWAFEMERRGAASVTAIDVDDPAALDWPASLRERHETALDDTKAERFALAARALGSRVERVGLSVYDLGPDALGEFDLVFCGDLLIHLRDPVRAVERMRSVCAGSAVIANNIRRFRL